MVVVVMEEEKVIVVVVLFLTTSDWVKTAITPYRGTHQTDLILLRYLRY